MSQKRRGFKVSKSFAKLEKNYLRGHERKTFSQKQFEMNF